MRFGAGGLYGREGRVSFGRLDTRAGAAANHVPASRRQIGSRSEIVLDLACGSVPRWRLFVPHNDARRVSYHDHHQVHLPSPAIAVRSARGTSRPIDRPIGISAVQQGYRLDLQYAADCSTHATAILPPHGRHYRPRNGRAVRRRAAAQGLPEGGCGTWSLRSARGAARTRLTARADRPKLRGARA